MEALEDEGIDIIEKAQAGLDVSDAALAARLGIDGERLQRLKRFGGPLLGALAEELRLHAGALQAVIEGTYHPQVDAPPGLLAVTTMFESMRVNAYLVWNPETGDAVAFDTGADCGALIAAVAERGLTPRAICLTHTHRDHIADLDRLRAAWSVPVYVGEGEDFDAAEGFEAGRRFAFGGTLVESRLTWGHSRGGVTFVVDRGVAPHVAVVGDAVFAGSMGGGRVSYLDALRTNRERIFTLEDSTILCPGHGPLTNVGLEKGANPFFASAFA